MASSSFTTTTMRIDIKAAAHIERTLRPWGWYETVAESPGHKIKRIGVSPGQRISLQNTAGALNTGWWCKARRASRLARTLLTSR